MRFQLHSNLSNEYGPPATAMDDFFSCSCCHPLPSTRRLSAPTHKHRQRLPRSAILPPAAAIAAMNLDRDMLPKLQDLAIDDQEGDEAGIISLGENDYDGVHGVFVNHYEVLGVSILASFEEIMRAYRWQIEGTGGRDSGMVGGREGMDLKPQSRFVDDGDEMVEFEQAQILGLAMALGQVPAADNLALLSTGFQDPSPMSLRSGIDGDVGATVINRPLPRPSGSEQNIEASASNSTISTAVRLVTANALDDSLAILHHPHVRCVYDAQYADELYNYELRRSTTRSAESHKRLDSWRSSVCTPPTLAGPLAPRGPERIKGPVVDEAQTPLPEGILEQVRMSGQKVWFLPASEMSGEAVAGMVEGMVMAEEGGDGKGRHE